MLSASDRKQDFCSQSRTGTLLHSVSGIQSHLKRLFPFLALVLLLGSTVLGVQTVNSAVSSFVFAAAADFGANSNTDTVLRGMSNGQTNFALAVGDLSYSQAGTEPTDGVTPSPWCNYVKNRISGAGVTYPFELVTGNHEVDGASNGRIDNFARCLPNLISSARGSGLCTGRDPSLGAGGCYGVEYYFDYPTSSPVVRVILFYHSSSDSIDGTKYNFGKGTVHYNWLSSVIDQAKAAGLWTIVATHKPCLSTGSGGSGCDMHKLLANKKVDLVITGHDHNYQRSKQLTCFSTSSFISSCVADDGSDGLYAKGQGTVYTVVGTGGGGLSSISASSVQNRYFVTWSGKNVNPTFGFLKVSVESASINVNFVPTRSGGTGGGSFIDSFSITGGPPPPPPAFDYSLSMAPSGGMVVQGSSISSSLTATLVSGSTENVAFSASGVPSGVTVGFSPTSCSPTCASSVPFNTSPSAAAGTYSITILGTSAGGFVRTTTYTLILQATGTRTLIFNATADAFVRNTSADSNFGTSTLLEVDSSPDVKNVLLKFDVSGIGSSTIMSVKLKLFCVGKSDKGGDFYETSSRWDERTVTWNLAPGTDGASLGTLGPVDVGKWYEVEVSLAVHGDGGVAFMVLPISTDGADYASRETANDPQLIITLSD